MSSVSGMIVLDIETSGLDEKSGVIFELGIAHVSTDLEILDTFHSYIFGQPEWNHFYNVWDETDYAFKMHQKSGLVAELAQFDAPLSEFEKGDVEWDAISWLLGRGVQDNKSEPMVGSSIHFDRKWLDHHMPRLAGIFGYRNIDASSNGEWAKKFRPDIDAKIRSEVNPQMKHRVIPDIQDTVDLFKLQRKWGLIA